MPNKSNTRVAVKGAATLPLRWNRVPDSLPPDPEGGWFSPVVWLALSDGTVEMGTCLHKRPDAKHDAPVHDWFIENKAIECLKHERGNPALHVVAWMPFAKPDHPNVLVYGDSKAA